MSDARIAELGIILPPAPKAMAVYQTAVRHGDLMYVSGHGPYQADGSLITGRLGADMDIEAGYHAARVTGLAILATLKAHLGSLDRVVRPIKVLGMVNCTPEFGDHPAVINGFSNLMVEVFGENGKAARSAVGMPSLPKQIAVEVEAIFEVRD
jgi:enamine deaminase RidA (YjgF/YER057c/UK114 family)